MKTNLKRIWMAILALVLATVACKASETPQTINTPASGGSAGRETLINATVQIYGLFEKNGVLVTGYTGSGTLISADGLILTNAHVADPAAVGDPDFHPDALGVGLVQSEDKPPTFAYRAEVLAIDGFLDLAVIRIVATMDGGSVDPARLNLPFVPLGDSETMHVGDHINIYGFPSIGGQTITYTDGNISGFTSEEQIGDRAWIKTDATISGGNSGGLAANDSGQIIGVPTQASSGAGGDITDCRVIQDTNGDGVLDNRDTCIPIGGFINALRPINLARPLISAAQTGIAYVSPYGQIAGTTPGSGLESFGSVTWLATDSDCTYHDAVQAYPSGVSAVTAEFDFSGMTDGQAWGSIWTADGEVIYQSADAWADGADGTYAFCLFNSQTAIHDGSYTVQFFVGDFANPRILSSGEVIVGNGAPLPTEQPADTSGGISLFGTVIDAATGLPIADAYVFVLQAGITYDFWASFNYPEDNILMQTRTDANGNYRMPSTFQRWLPYTIVITASGYYDKYGDSLVWYDTDPSEYRLDAEMNK